MNGGASHITAFFFACAICLAGCHKEQPGKVFPAFYHWKTNLQLSENERLYLDSLGVKKLYVKFFDVDWDEATGQPLPHAQVQIDTARLAGLEIVPTVFITNRTWLRLRMEDVDSLAWKTIFKINDLDNDAKLLFREVQFDSDWTGQTKEKYFRFLKTIGFIARDKMMPVEQPVISATIRLHQLKFFEKTGIPPVDRGMLMFYNMGDLEAWETDNSILDPATGKKYLTPDAKYPLPLDFALPIFRWGVLFRDGNFFKLINDLGEEDLQDTLRFTPITSRRFLVKKSTYLQGYYLYEDDLIRLESVKTGQLEAAAALLGNMFPPAERTVGFYHLDSGLVRGFPAKNLEKVLEKIK